MGEHLNEFGNSEVYIVGDDGGYKKWKRLSETNSTNAKQKRRGFEDESIFCSE